MGKDKAKEKRHTDLIALLVIHETGLSTLYRAFAKKFPEYESFWSDLSRQEQGHAGVLRELKNKTTVKDSADYRKRLGNEAVLASLVNLRGEIRRAARIEDPIEAFTVAYNFETATVERKYYEIFKEDGGKITRTFDELARVTQEHAEQITEMRVAALARAGESAQEKPADSSMNFPGEIE